MLKTQEIRWRSRIAAAALHRADAESAREFAAGDHGLDPAARAEFLRRHEGLEPASVGAIDDVIPAEERRRRGAFFTPPELAERLAIAAVEPDETGWVVDLSCGDGALLAAVAERAPNAKLLGVDVELELCAAASARLPQAQIVWGDGLASPRVAGTAAVIGNPPYVGEKNNRELFERLRADHADLEPWFGARLDLHYLFVHRALDYLRPGGRLVYLTSEYWLTATGAGRLRADLTARTRDRAFERLGAGAFASAPGHHSLIFSAIRGGGGQHDESTWHPFAEVSRETGGMRFGDIATDRQGFVSGADRVTARAAAKWGLEAGRPVYLYEPDEVVVGVPEFRPVLRASECEANRVVQQVDSCWALWLDGEAAPSDGALRLLEPYRPMLEKRREAAIGRMPWWRIWWPRRTQEYGRPKLVVPRRTTRAAMCLDLSGSLVSSDCTYILAPDDIEEEVAWLVRIMVVANSERAIEQLRAFGKTKGDIIEFYSTPLTDWNLELDLESGRLTCRDAELEAQARQILDLLPQCSSTG